MTGDDDRLTDTDRKSLRILATSTKSTSANQRIIDRLERAADSGLRVDYERAESTFDALPAGDRAKIGTQAQRQAEIERTLLRDRKRRMRAASARINTPAGAVESNPLDWLTPVDPDAALPPPPPPAPRDGNTEDTGWKLGSGPVPKLSAKPLPAKTKPVQEKPRRSKGVPGAGMKW